MLNKKEDECLNPKVVDEGRVRQVVRDHARGQGHATLADNLDTSGCSFSEKGKYARRPRE